MIATDAKITATITISGQDVRYEYCGHIERIYLDDLADRLEPLASDYLAETYPHNVVDLTIIEQGAMALHNATVFVGDSRDRDAELQLSYFALDESETIVDGLGTDCKLCQANEAKRLKRVAVKRSLTITPPEL